MKTTIKVFVDTEHGDITVAQPASTKDAIDIEVIEVSIADDCCAPQHGCVPGRTELNALESNPDWITDRHSFS